MNQSKELDANISDLIGLTMKSVAKDNDMISFESIDGRKFTLEHNQNCCEEVVIQEIVGDLTNLIGQPILCVEKVEDESFSARVKFETNKGTVFISWEAILGGCGNWYTVVDCFEHADLHGPIFAGYDINHPLHQSRVNSETIDARGVTTSKWYLNGKFHREDGPAIEFPQK
mgnify:FL=1